MKRLSILFSIIFILPFTSCCDQEYAVITEFRVYFSDGLEHSMTSDTFFTNVDTLFIGGLAETKLVRQEKWSLYSSNFGLMATSCPEPLLRQGYELISITSTANFNDIPAGDNLMDIFMVQSFRGSFQPLSSASMETLNLAEGSSVFGGEHSFGNLALVEKPTISTHQFTIELLDDGGDTFLGVSPVLVWE